jgi:hypothetical protein
VTETRHELDAHFILQLLINRACLRGETDEMTLDIPWQNLITYQKSGSQVSIKGNNLRLTISTKWVHQVKDDNKGE